MSDHYRGPAIDFRDPIANQRRFFRRMLEVYGERFVPRRVVLWGGREGDIQFGSPEDRAQERRRRTIRWGVFSHPVSDHLHVAARR